MLPHSPAAAPDPDTAPDTPPAPAPGRVIVITGAMAAGKSTVAKLLARTSSSELSWRRSSRGYAPPTGSSSSSPPA